ncbi:MAG: SDR family oxidoreductase [Candidatus Saccharimonas sp.]
MNIVLGGTSGLGKEIANTLRERGEDAFVLGRSYIESKDGQGLAVDLTDRESVEKAALHISKVLGGEALKGFWWVAGEGRNIDFHNQAHPENMAIANFAGALPLVQLAWRKLLADGEGTLAIVSSTSGVTPRADEAVYVGTKYAQVGFGRSLGLEAERLETSARVALFLPGGMRTEFWDKAQPDSRPEVYSTFNDPVKVARRMVDEVDAQTTTFTEVVIARGELV